MQLKGNFTNVIEKGVFSEAVPISDLTFAAVVRIRILRRPSVRNYFEVALQMGHH